MAYSFDGTGDYLSFTKSAGATDLSTITYSFWYKKGTFSGAYREIFWSGGSWSTNFHTFVQHDSSNYMVLRANWTGGVGSWSVANPTDNTWTNDVWTYSFSSSSNDPICYRNGTSITVTERTTPSGTADYAKDDGTINIGAGDAGGFEYWIGDIAEFAIWNRVLSASEASILGQAFAPSTIPNGLVFYSKLDRGLQDIKGTVGTATNAVVSAHPRIINPHTGYFFSKPTEAPVDTATVTPLTLTATIPLVGAHLDGYPNLMLNASFETGSPGNTNIPSGWTAYNSGGAPDYKGISTGWSYDGVQSFRMDASTVSDTGIKIQIPGLTVGQQYTLSAYVKTDADVDNLALVLDSSQDSAGGSSTQTTNIGASQEGRFSTTMTADSTAMNIFIGLGSFGSASDGEAFIDAVQFEWGATATDFAPTSENIQTATVAPVTLTLTPPAVTATFINVDTASVSPLALTATIPAVTATYNSIQTASVAPITAQLTIPATTATYYSIQTATVAPLATTLTISAVTATYVYEQTATVAPLTTTLTITTTTATYVYVNTATVAPLTLTLTQTAVTATYASVQTATVEPLTLTIIPPAVTATHVSIWSASVAPLTTTLTLPAITATYASVLSATVAPLSTALTLPAITATYVYENTASVVPVTLTLTLPVVTPTYSGSTTASVAPLTLTLTTPAISATYVYVVTASVSPLSTTLTIPAVTTTYASVQTASLAPAQLSLTATATTATHASVQTAIASPIQLTLTMPAVTGLSTVNATVTPLALLLSTPAVTATYSTVQHASVAPIQLTLTAPAITATYLMIATAGVSPLTLALNIPTITAVGESSIWQDPNQIDWYADNPQVFHNKADGDWYEDDPQPFNTQNTTDWKREY